VEKHSAYLNCFIDCIRDELAHLDLLASFKVQEQASWPCIDVLAEATATKFHNNAIKGRMKNTTDPVPKQVSTSIN
jgi:hypothetical protein